jgi:hypothetical protein
MRQYLILITTVLALQTATAQQDSHISGSLEALGSFYFRDTAKGAAGTPQYDHQLFGSNAWLNLQYNNSGFDIGVRYDMFQNTNLFEPKGSYTGQGLGRWYLKKKIDKIGITIGHIYDQIGSGIIFRAYEERALGIDNALVGLSATYDLSPDWKIKAFTGRQKNQFELYNPVLRGTNIEGFATLSDSNKISIAPGIGLIAKTYDDETITQITDAVATYTRPDSIGVNYNSYAFTAYNTLTAGNFSWYIEGAYKTADILFDPKAEKTNKTGTISLGKLVQKSGIVLYSTMSYTATGFGITLEGKRTENFSSRTTPFVTGTRGAINFLPPMSRQNTYRLTARYSPATQELGEQAIAAEIKYAPTEKWHFGINVSKITDLNAKPLYQEIYADLLTKFKKGQLSLGVQIQDYNIDTYLNEPGEPNVKTITPFLEYLHKFSDTKALRLEAQYLSTQQDYGSWAFGLIEYSVSPHWIFTLSDMLNTTPIKKDANGNLQSAQNYPSASIAYTRGVSRLNLSFVQQPQGVVCSGGICRLEPAFSGLRLGINTSF